MSEKYYIDKTGKFIGIFVGATPPEDSIEVDSLPPHGDAFYVDGEWILNKTSLILRNIMAIEDEITPRRIREALLTPEGAEWLSQKEQEIEALRTQL